MNDNLMEKIRKSNIKVVSRAAFEKLLKESPVSDRKNIFLTALKNPNIDQDVYEKIKLLAFSVGDAEDTMDIALAVIRNKECNSKDIVPILEDIDKKISGGDKNSPLEVVPSTVINEKMAILLTELVKDVGNISSESDLIERYSFYDPLVVETVEKIKEANKSGRCDYSDLFTLMELEARHVGCVLDRPKSNRGSLGTSLYAEVVREMRDKSDHLLEKVKEQLKTSLPFQFSVDARDSFLRGMGYGINSRGKEEISDFIEGTKNILHKNDMNWFHGLEKTKETIEHVQTRSLRVQTEVKASDFIQPMQEDAAPEQVSTKRSV